MVAPLPVCEIALVACELFVICGVGVVVCTGVPVPCVLALVQAVSYCEGAPAPWRALVPYFTLALPPLTLLTPGSLKIDPGAVAALPGDWLDFVQSWPWFASAYAVGAAPMTAMATMQLAANSLRLIFVLRFRARSAAHPTGHTISMGIWFK